MQEPATHLVRRSGGETWCGLPASGVTLAGHGDPWKPVGRLCSDCEAAKLAYLERRDELTAKALLEQGVTADYLVRRERLRAVSPRLHEPAASSPGWWGHYREGYVAGLEGRYKPPGAQAAANGYDAGHFDGTTDAPKARAEARVREHLGEG